MVGWVTRVCVRDVNWFISAVKGIGWQHLNPRGRCMLGSLHACPSVCLSVCVLSLCVCVCRFATHGALLNPKKEVRDLE